MKDVKMKGYSEHLGWLYYKQDRKAMGIWQEEEVRYVVGIKVMQARAP